MNVLFQSRYQYPFVESGGVGIVVYELMKELPALCKKFEHWTWDSHTSASTEIVDSMVGFNPVANIELHDKRLSLLFDLELTNLAMIKRYEAPTFNFDVLHAHTWELSLAAVIAKHTKGIPLVYTTHDIMQNDAHDELNQTADIYGHGVLCEKIMLSEADRIVAVSEENRELLTSIYPEVTSKTVVIPNGVDTEQFTPSAALPTKENLSPGYILFIGRAVPSKGIEAIISMLIFVPDSIQMVFALSTVRWDGEKHPKADAYVEMIQMLKQRRPNTVLILNEWRRDIVAGLYANASITLMPSTYEPCGMVALESQACGTPVITNATGFMKDSVQDGETGIILHVSPDDEKYAEAMAKVVTSLIGNSALLKKMGRSGRINVEKRHSWSLRAHEHYKLYIELMSESGSR